VVSLARPLAFTLVALVVLACSRQVELRDDANHGSNVGTQMLPEAGTLTEVPDAGFDDPKFGACTGRPSGACVGVNDFPCDFPRWVTATAQKCQTMTECRADDWVRVGMNAEGCVDSISMLEAEPSFVACMVEELGPYHCPCGEGFADHFLGIDNDGCFVGCTDELPCAGPYHCISGFCIPD